MFFPPIIATVPTDASAISNIAEDYTKLGTVGAVLFILLVFVVYMFKSNNKIINKFAEVNSTSISQLCTKIDKLANSNEEMAKALVSTFTKLTDDQNNNARFLMETLDNVNKNSAKLESIDAKIDTLMNLKCKPNDQSK